MTTAKNLKIALEGVTVVKVKFLKMEKKLNGLFKYIP